MDNKQTKPIALLCRAHNPHEDSCISGAVLTCRCPIVDDLYLHPTCVHEQKLHGLGRVDRLFVTLIGLAK